MIILACPGQGSQTPGFLTEWLQLPLAAEFLAQASERTGVDLVRHGTLSDAHTIRDTRIAQPLIVAATLLAWHALSERVSLAGAGVAGHSVGEFAAAAIAGVMAEGDALQLVSVRGRAMADAAVRSPTGMSAVLGGVEAEVLAAIDRHGLTVANYNGGGQLVAAGALTSLAALAEDPPRGTRVLPLQVAGAFHSEYMAGAVAPLSQAAQTIRVSDPVRPLWTNADGSQIERGTHFLELMVSQVARPVRWDACLASMRAAGVTGLIELTPAGALTGIAKRVLKGIPAVAVKTPADLDAAVELFLGRVSLTDV